MLRTHHRASKIFLKKSGVKVTELAEVTKFALSSFWMTQIKKKSIDERFIFSPKMRIYNS